VYLRSLHIFMQRYAVLVFALTAVLIAGCGSGKSKTPTATTVTVSPSTASLEVGRFLALTATVVDANGTTLTSLTPTWSTSNANIVDVSTNGAICAGKWNSTTAPTICTPGTPGQATITATAGGASGSVIVSTHIHIARLVVGSNAGTTCTSQGQTQQFFAVAFDAANQDITSSVGAVTFSVSDSTVASIDGAGLVTAKRPGAALVTASVSDASALPATFTTCPPAAIVIGQQGNMAQTAFTVASPQTTVLAATVTDTKGNPVTDLALTFASSAPGVASVTTNALTGTVTANVVGQAGIVASCSPPACNPGVNRTIVSNVAKFTITGALTQKVVAASANSNTIAIIDQTNAVVATPTIPPVTVNGAVKNPVLNSIVMAGDGSKVFFGSDVGVLQLDLSTNTFLTTVFLFPGRVLASSADGAKVLVGDGSFTVLDVSANTAGTQLITGKGSADISLAKTKAYMAVGSTLNSVNGAGTASTALGLASAATDVRFLEQGSIAFVAEPGANVQIFVACDDSSAGSVAAQPQLLASSNDSTRMFGANTTTVFSITPTVAPPAIPTPGISDCAPQVSTTVTSAALGATISPRQVLAAPNASRAVVLGDSTSVFSYADGGAVTTIPLSGGGTSTTGGITPDSALLYVGTTNGDVQKIDLGSGLVLQSIPAGLKNGAGTGVAPDFVAVRPK
jgi:hypothetical protein